jgi:Tfp pilus assembly protein PilF
VFRLNASEFPQSGDAWESLAGGYLAAGQKLLAAIYYRKTLEVDPQNGDALEKLRELEAKPAE